MVFGLGCQQKMVEKSSTLDEQRGEKSLPCKKPGRASFGQADKLLLNSDFSLLREKKSYQGSPRSHN